MSDFNWCHGPECHKKHTVDRVRGVKGSKVLRTRKINQSNEYIRNSVWSHFCSQNCYDNFANAYIDQIVAIAPCTEAKETPINDPQKVRPYEGAQWYNTEITVDETRQR